MPLAPKPWQPSFGPLPRQLAGRILVQPAFAERVRRAANQFYINETAAIRDEPDEDIARERAARLDETLNDAVIVARTGVLSPSAARLMEACETIFESPSAAARKASAEPAPGGDRRPSPGASLSPAGELAATRTDGGRHEDLAAPKPDFPLNPAGKLLQLRPGQDVPVFGDVAFDSRKQVMANG